VSAVEDYLRDKILAAVAAFEESLIGRDPPNIARLIKAIEPVDRPWFQIITSAKYLSDRLAEIRRLVETGNLVEAGIELENFKANRQLVIDLLLKFDLARFRRARGRRKGSARVATDDVMAELKARCDSGEAPTSAARDIIRERNLSRMGEKNSADALVKAARKSGFI